jgi:DNA-directed RNA polymerase specialized sigma24 family protein
VSTESPAFAPPASATASLASPAIRRYLEGYVRRRMRPSDAEDVVQAVLCAALEAARVPADEEELRRWLTGIARNKIASTWSRQAREPVSEVSASESMTGAPAPLEERALVDWAEREASAHGGASAAKTLAWMAREGEGDKLESIAIEEREPAARVRQRVSRLRRWLRTRWAAELALAGVLVLMVLMALVFLIRHRATPAPTTPLMRPDMAITPPAPSASVAPAISPSSTPPPAPSSAPSTRSLAPPTSTSVPSTPRPTKPGPRRTSGSTPTGSSI